MKDKKYIIIAYDMFPEHVGGIIILRELNENIKTHDPNKKPSRGSKLDKIIEILQQHTVAINEIKQDIVVLKVDVNNLKTEVSKI
jgi:hypothetical protein